MMKKRSRHSILAAVLALVCAFSMAACGGADDTGKSADSTQKQSKKEASANGSENGNAANEDRNGGKNDGETDGSEGKGRIDTIHQTVTDFVGTYYDRYGESFEVVKSGAGIKIVNFKIDTRRNGWNSIPDSGEFYDSDCEMQEYNGKYIGMLYHFGENLSDNEIVDGAFYFNFENGYVHLQYYYTDIANYDVIGRIDEDFSLDPSIVEDIHYYRTVTIKPAERVNTLSQVHDVFVYHFQPGGSDGNCYFTFTYDTDTGFVQKIEYTCSYSQDDYFEGTYTQEGLDNLKSEADKYRLTSVTASGSTLRIEFSTEKIGRFEQYIIRNLLDGRQDIEGYIKEVYTDQLDQYDGSGKLGDHFVYDLFNGYVVEWHD